jgi:hypothetical protein
MAYAEDLKSSGRKTFSVQVRGGLRKENIMDAIEKNLHEKILNLQTEVLELSRELSLRNSSGNCGLCVTRKICVKKYWLCHSGIVEGVQCPDRDLGLKKKDTIYNNLRSIK